MMGGSIMEGMHLVLALVVGLALVIVLILKTKIQAFPALLIASVSVGLIGGMSTADVVSNISSGFGSTLSSIGIVIALGVMMGKMLEVTGAAKKMAVSILKIVGVERTEVVLAMAGWLVSIPVFCDSGFVILSELAKEFSRDTKKSMISLGCALGIGLLVTHHLVPPTPGPLAVAATFGVDIGLLIIYGMVISLLILAVALTFAKHNAKKFEIVIPEADLQAVKFTDEELPGAVISFAPIIVPVVLILLNTLCSALSINNSIVNLIGSPVIAVLIGLLISIYGLARSKKREEVVRILENSLGDAGLIIVITGAGGALGTILRVSGIGDYVAGVIASSGFPAVLVPLLMAALLKIAQGSGTVAMVTTASIVAPMCSTLGLSPMLGCLACCIGSMCVSHFNDSYFWVVTRISGMDVKTGLRAWTATTGAAALTGFVIMIILSFVM